MDWNGWNRRHWVFNPKNVYFYLFGFGILKILILFKKSFFSDQKKDIWKEHWVKKRKTWVRFYDNCSHCPSLDSLYHFVCLCQEKLMGKVAKVVKAFASTRAASAWKQTRFSESEVWNCLNQQSSGQIVKNWDKYRSQNRFVLRLFTSARQSSANAARPHKSSRSEQINDIAIYNDIVRAISIKYRLMFGVVPCDSTRQKK